MFCKLLYNSCCIFTAPEKCYCSALCLKVILKFGNVYYQKDLSFHVCEKKKKSTALFKCVIATAMNRDQVNREI